MNTFCRVVCRNLICSTRFLSSQIADLGSGVGKGGGAGGSIREAGGGFGKLAAANEEQYFHKKQLEQLEKLKSDLTGEMNFHEKETEKSEDIITAKKEQGSKVEEQ